MASPVLPQQEELTEEQIRERIRQRRGGVSAGVQEPGRTEEEIRTGIRERLGPEPLPVAEPLVITRPRPPLPLEPPTQEARAAEARRFPAKPLPHRGLIRGSKAGPQPGLRDYAAQLRVMAEGIRTFFTSAGEGRPEEPVGAPAVADVTLGAAGLPDIERRALAGEPSAPTVRAEGVRPTPQELPALEIERKAVVRGQQEIAAKSLPSRTAFALGAGTLRFAEAIINPLDPDQRKFTRALAHIQSGGGLVAPIDEHRNFLVQFGLGLAEYVPTLVGLAATGVLGTVGRVTATSRAAIVGALEEKFGRRLAVRIFEEALKESVEEGLSIALFESVIGRGAGMGPGGRLQVFGEEVLAETGGFVFGAGFGAGRQVFRELSKSTGRISRQIFNSGIQNQDQITAILQTIAEREGRTFDEVFSELAGEVQNAPSVMGAIRRRIRSGAGEIPPMKEIQGERAALVEEQAIAEAEAPIRAFAQDLAQGGTVQPAGALRAIRREFPRINVDDAAEFVADAYGVPRGLPGPVDVGGRPRAEVEPEAEAAGRPGARDPRARAEVSSRLARLEARADRSIRGLAEPEAIGGDVPLEVLQESADAIITKAASLGENALVDRAARLSAKIRDMVENPPVRPAKPEPKKAPEKPVEEAKPEPTPRAKEEPKKPARAERETPEGRLARLGQIEERLQSEIVVLEGKERSSREASRLAFLRQELEQLQGQIAEPQPEPAKVQQPAAIVRPADVLPPAERLDLQQRAQIEEIIPEASKLSDEELAEEMARLGIEPRFAREAPEGRRVTDLTDRELMARVQAAGQELPEAGPEFRERLLELVDPNRTARMQALEEERRELRGRLAGEIRGRRGAEREGLRDELTGLQNQKAFLKAKARADADPETSIVAFDVIGLKQTNELISEVAGDDLIRVAGRAVGQAAEEFGLTGAAFRSGGDEFKIFAPNDVADDVRLRAQAIMGTPAIPGTEFKTGLHAALGETVEKATAILGRQKAVTRAPKPEEPVVPEKPKVPPTPEPKVGVTEKPAGERVGPKYEDAPNILEDVTEFGELGIDDQVLVERPDGSTTRVAVQYAILEVGDVSPSHKITAGGKSQRNPAYVDELQPREKLDIEFIEKRARDPFTDDQGRQQGFDENLIVMRSPTPERGPPIIDEYGVVFGGNNRDIIIKRVYENDTVAAQRLRDKIAEEAESFGIQRDFVEDFRDPVLVRVLKERPADLATARALADDLNRTAIQARTPTEEAVLASERLSVATVKFFEDAFPADGTIRGFMRTAEGREFLRRLEKDAVITAEQRKGLFDKEGDLNDQGRDFIENLIFARAVGSADAIDRLSKSVRAKLLKAAPGIATTSGKFDLKPSLQQAIRMLEQTEEGATIRDIMGQADLFGQGQYSPFAAQLAHFLETTKTQAAVADAFRKYSESAKVGAAEAAGQTTLVTPLRPREAFTAAFGKEFLQGDVGGTLDFAGEPTLAREATQPRIKPSEEQLKRLREAFGERTPEQIAETQRAFEGRRQRREERRAARGETKRAPVQRGRGKKRGAKPAPAPREPGPGQSGGGRAGDESRDVNPPGEPGVARGQRQREQQRVKTEDKRKAREKALEDERQRFKEAVETQDVVSDIKKVRESIRGQIRAAGKEAGIADRLVDEQLRDISRIQSNLLDVVPDRNVPRPGYLVGNSPGTGKTFVGAGVIKEVLERRGKATRILVVVPGKAEGPIVKQWVDVGREVFDYGMTKFEPGETMGPGVYHMSATGLGNQWAPKLNKLKTDFGNFDLVVFDESHMFSNVYSANRAFAARALRRQVGDHKILHLSATPFEFPWDMAYMENLRLWGPGRPVQNFQQWLAKHGVRKSARSNQWYFVKSTREDVLRTLIEIRREMMEAGVYSQREMKMDKGLRNMFVEIAMDEPYGSYYIDVMSEIADLEARATGVEVNLLKSARVTFDRRITELAKIPRAIKLAKDLLEQGKSVAIFTGYKMNFQMAPRMAERFPTLNAVIESINDQVRQGIERLVRELGGEDVVGQVHGGITSGKKRGNDITDFQSGKKKILVATVDAGGTGLSLHDLSGKHPRAQINLTLPWTGKAAEQLAGRTYRFGSKTDTEMVWTGMDTPVERNRLRRVAGKMESMGALVQGKTDTDAIKLAEFDFLPEAEMQQILFGYKKEFGLEPKETSLDFRGKPHQQAPTESAGRRRLDQVHQEFLSALSEEAKAPGLVVQGTHPTAAAVREDLELPRPNQKIIKPSTIIGKGARRMAVRVFLGGIKQPNVAGRFKIVADLVRLRSAQNVRVAAHELGHHVDLMDFGFLTHPRDVAATVPTHLLPFVDELKPLAYAGAKDEVTEGFAEFVAEYVIRPKYAQDQAPKFFKYFRDHMNRVNPKDLDVLDWMQQQMELFRSEYSAAERIGSRLIIGDSGELGDLRFIPGKRFRKWYAKWMDFQQPFKEMDQLMSVDDPNWVSLQMLARRTFGADPLAENQMFRGIMDFKDLDQNNKVTRVSKGLPEIFEKVDSRGKFDLFNYWTVARRAKELRARNLETGFEDLIEDGTIDKLIRQVEADPELNKLFEQVWKDLSEYQDALLKWLVDSQNLTPTQVVAMKKLNEFYVPWYRLMSEPDHLQDWVAEAKASGGKGVDGVVGLPPAIHFFKGDTRPIINPVESIVGNTRYFTQLGFRKQVENAVAKFSNDVFGADGHGRFITAIDPKLVASRYSVRQIKQALETFGIRVEDVSDEQLAELLTLFHPMSTRKNLPAFSAIIDGKRKWFQVNDPDTWTAMAGMNKVEFSWLTNLAITAKSVLRNGVVMSPEFMVRNFIRDAQTAWIQTPARGAGTAGAIRKIPMTAAVEGLVESIKGGKLWDEFVASGAAGSALTQISRRSNQQYMRQMFGRKGMSRYLAASHGVAWNARQVYRMVRDQAQGAMYDLQHVGTIFENANRLSTFRASREEGANFLSAGFAARNVSTDFAVHGAGLQAWRLSTAFLNPAAQGTARIARQFKQRPLLTLARSSMLTLTSAALWWYNQQDPDYPEYSANLKSRYWIWRSRKSGIIYRLPKTYVYGDIFGSFLAEAFLDWAFDRDPEIVRRLGVVLGQAFGFTMVPTLALAPLELALNRSLYFNTPIESQSMREQLPKEFRSRAYTSEVSRKLSMALARFAESADTRGLGRIGRFINKLNLSPVQYDHVVRSYFGTLGFDVWNDMPNLIRLGRNGVRKIEGLEPLPFPPNARARNHFFVRGFTIQFPTGSAESIRRFYDRRDVLNELAMRYSMLQGLADEGADETSESALRAVRFFENHIEEILTAPLYEQTAGALAVLARQKANATSSEEIDQINRQGLELAQDALRLIGDLTPAEKQLLEQRTRESLFARSENKGLQAARDRIDLMVMRRQLRGVTKPTDGESDMVAAIIRAVPGLTGSQRASLRRYYKRIREGSIVDREFGKTPKTTRRRFLRQQEQKNEP